MSDTAARIAALSPEQREALMRRLARPRPAEVAAAEPPRLVPRPGERHRPFPLTDVQQVYWAGRSGYFDLPTPSGGANVCLTLDLAGDDSFLGRLESAVDRLAERHEVMKLVMLPGGRQRILDRAPPFRTERVDLRALSPTAAEAERDRNTERLRYRSGRIGRWPLFGICGQVLPEGRVRLNVWFDAWMIDGRSRDVLMDDLLLLLGDDQRRLPRPELSYRDFALYREEERRSERHRRDREHWLGRIDSIPPPPELPLAVTPSPRLSARLTRRSLRLLGADGWRRLRERAGRRALTPSAPLFAAFAEVLAAWSARPALSFGLEGTHKPPVHRGIGDLVGNFNTVHVLAVRDDAADFTARARDLQEQVASALEHASFSGFEVLREIDRRRGGGRHSRMPVLFNSLVEYAHPRYRRAAGASVAGIPVIEGAEVSGHLSQVLLLVAVLEQGPRELCCEVHSVDEAFPEGWVERFTGALAELVRRLADDEAPWSASRPATGAGMPIPPPAPGSAVAPAPGPVPSRGPVAAARSLEPEIARLVGEVLGVDDVAPDDDFYRLGGDSFTAVLLLSRIEERFGADTDLGEFLSRSTVRRLARLLGRARPAALPSEHGGD